MAELGVGYISVVPTVKDVTPGIRKALGGAEGAAAQAGGAAGEKYNGAFGKVAGKLGGALKKTAMGAGVAAGGAITVGITKGIGRLNSIEQAEAKLTGLGNSGKQVGSIMEDALASVKGTSFGLEEAATTAAGMVASGIKPGKELAGVLTTVGDTATIAGTNMQDMGQIFGSVAARGKLQGDDMMQLLGRGIPVLQLLGDELGKTSEEISDMVSAGEIDFATFEAAMRKGMGGAAQEAGQTAEGAFKNMWAAAGRLGANLAGPFFNQAAGAFGGVTDALDGMDAKVKPAMERFDSWLTDTGIPAAKQFASETVAALRSVGESDTFQATVARTVEAVKSLWDAGKSLGPVFLDIGKSIAQASAALGVSGWQALMAALQLTGTAAQALAGPLETVSGIMQDHPTLVTAAVAAYAGFKTLPGIASKVATAFAPIGTRVKGVGEAFGEASTQAKSFAAAHPEVSKLGVATKALSNNVPAIARMGEAYQSSSAGLRAYAAQQRTAAASAKALALSQTDAFTAADALGRQMGGTLKANIATVGATAKGVGAAGMSAMKSAMSGAASAGKGLVGALGGPWAVGIMAAGAAVMTISENMRLWNQHQEASNALAESGTVAYGAMFDTLSTGGDAVSAMSDQVESVTDHLRELDESNDGLAAGIGRANNILSVFTNGLGGVQKAIKQNAFDEAADDAKAAADAIEDLGMSNEELSQKIVGSAGNWSAFKDRLVESGEGGAAAAEQLQKLRDAHVQASAEVERMGPAAASAESVIKELATTTGDAADRASKLRRAFMELRGVEVDATEAAADLTSEVQQLSDKLDGAEGGMSEFAGATVKANGALDASTPAGAALYETLDSLGDSMQRSVAAGNDANAVFGQSKDQLAELQRQSGLNKDEWDKLLEVMGMTPDEMSIVADVQSDAALTDLAKISNQIKGLGGEADNKPIPIKINDEEAKQKLEAAGFELENWDHKTGSADLDLTDDGAMERYNWWVSEGFPAIDTADPTAKANLDDSGLLYKTEYAKMQLATLDLQRPFPWADMDIGSLSQKQLEALQKVGLLDGQQPTPDAFMDISQMSAKQQEALAKVFNLDAQKPTPAADMDKSQLDAKKGQADGQISNLDSQKAVPKADLNNDGVRQGAEESKSWIAGILGKTVTVTFEAVYKGFKNMIGLGDNSTGGLWTGPSYDVGGRHGGYRLPKTGPGTETVDGFTAYDKDMIPAARLDAGEWIINRRSSDKYNRELAEINAGTFPKLKGYADGGRYRHADEIDKFARGLEGKPYVWGGVNWGDCSGAMSAIARYAVGMDPFGGRFATGNMGSALDAMGFKRGRGGPGDLRFGWYNGGPWGGHTSGTLPNGVNVEMGGGRGNGQYGGPAAGADAPDNTDHAHLTVPGGWAVSGVEGAEAFATPEDRTYGSGQDTYDDSPIEPSTRSRSGASSTSASSAADNRPTSWSDVAATAASAAAKGFVSDALGVFGIPDTPPALAAQKEYYEAKREFEEEKRKSDEESQQSRSGADTAAPTKTPSEAGQTRSHQPPPNLDMPSNLNRTVEIAYDPAGGAQQWKSTVEMALQRTSLALSNVSRTIEQIDIESGGDPNAKNDWDINAQNGDPSIGLLQVIKSTFEANRDKELPNDQRHPLANIVAALNYTKGRYGGPDKIWPTRAGYRDGGLVLGPGGGRSDSIDARLSNREFVTNASATAKNLGLLQAINGGAAVQPAVEAAVSLMDMLDRSSSWTPGVPRVPESTLRRTSSSADRGGDHIENTFISANPQEMQRLYRRESSRGKRGRVGARR